MSYIFPSSQASWSSIDYKSEIDAFIIYKTTSLENNFNYFNDEDRNKFENSILKFSKNENQIASGNLGTEEQFDKRISKLNHPHLFSLVINKISMSQDGKLIIEFTSIPSFKGKLIIAKILPSNFYF